MVNRNFIMGRRNDAEQLAASMLQRAGLECIPVYPGAVAQAYGIGVTVVPGMDPLSARGRIINGTPQIEVSATDATLRQRFAVAHALGHFVAAPNQEFEDPAANFSNEVSDPVERFANEFALALLMPKDAVHYLVGNEAPDINRYAYLLQVAPYAMKIRLQHLGYLNDDPPLQFGM